MLTFLRKIRKSLIETESNQKYILYAVGEIALVVIGILIALQINNWNEGRKKRIQEQSYLAALHKEFNVNRERLDELIKKCDNSVIQVQKLIEHTGPNESNIMEKEFNKLIAGSIIGELKFRPSSGVLEEIISSGKLDIFRNTDLKSYLASWSGHLQKIKFQEDQEHGSTRASIINQIEEEGNWRKIITDVYGSNIGVSPTKFQSSNLNVLRSEKFENHLMGFIATGKFLNNGYYIPARNDIDKVLTLMNKEMDN